MLPALSVSKSVSAYSPSPCPKLKMTFVVAAVTVASERVKTAVAATALIRRSGGNFIETIPTGAGCRVKKVFATSRSSQSSLRNFIGQWDERILLLWRIRLELRRIGSGGARSWERGGKS